MSDFVEKVTLNLDGNVADGTASKALGGTSGAVGTLLDGLKSLAAFTGAALGIGEMVKTAIGANVEFDRMITRTATLLGVFEKWTGVAAGSAGALEMAREATIGLEQAQFKVMGTSDDLFGLYQRLLPVMVTSGAKSTEQMVGFSTSVAKFADITGQSYEGMAQALSHLITTGQMMSMHGGSLIDMLKNLGITPEQIQSWRQAGTVIQNLTPFLEKASAGVDRLKSGWAGATADIKKGAHEILQEAFEPTFLAITEGARTVRDALMTMTPSGAEMNQSIVKPLSAAFFTAFEVAKVVVGTGWAAIKAIGDDSARASGVSFSRLLSDSFIDLGITLIKLWHEVVGLFIPGIELLRHPVDALVALVENLIDGVIGAASKAASFLGMDTLAKRLADISEAYGEVAAERNKFVTGVSDAWQQNDARTNAALSSLQKYKEELNKPPMSTTGLSGLLPGGPPPLSQQQIDALLNADNAIAKLNADLGKTLGLSGYSEAVAKIEAQFAGVNVQIDVLEHALEKLGLSGTKQYAQLEALRTRYGSAEAAQLEKAAVDATNAYEGAYAKIGKLASETTSEQIEASRQSKLQQLADLTEIEAANVTSNAAAEAAVKHFNDVKKAINDEAALRQKTLLDESTGNWAGYYDDLVKIAVKAGAGIVEAMQTSLKTVADKAYANAATIADGVNAALLKIRSELKTEGQIWSDYLTGIWGGITTGLGTVLKTLETGTGTIKDTLKGILNSLLDSFNTMVLEMVKKWLLGQDQMKAGSSGSGGLGSLFAGAGVASSINAQGDVVYHGGTINTVTKGQGTQGVVTQQQPSGVGLGSVIGGAAAGASMFSSTGGSGFAQVVGTVGGAALGGGLAAIGAALIAGIEIPVLGWIAAAVGVILIGLSAILKPNTETKIFGREFAPQIKAVAEGIQSSLVDVFATSLLPDAAGFAKSLNDRIKTYLQSANFFEVHAGSSEDITKDIQTLLSGIIPTELLHTLIGQQRTGGQDVAGISGASKYGGELDPKAPINQMLTDLGFLPGKIQWLADQIDTMAPTDWMKMLSGLVGVVAAAGTLGKQLRMTYAETIASADADAAKSPAGKLADRLAGVTDLLKAVSFYTGTEQITKGQEAIAAAQQFYTDAKTAMLQLSAMAKQVTQDVTDETKKIRDALKTPGELFAQSFSDLQHDYDRMRFAANPEDMAAAWASAKADFEAVAGELVNRIKQIKSLLDDIHTLQAAIANGPGPNATTDPQAWLAQNTIDIGKFETAMKSALPGSPEEIAAATSMAGKIRDRYTMELDLLARVKSTIESIDASFASSIEQLRLQSIGGIDPATGQWKADAHAQGQFAFDQITRLRGEIAGAKTPEALAAINTEIQKWLGFLSSQPQDPAHYLESRNFLIGLSGEIQKQFDAAGATMTTTINNDISTLGTKLSEAETRMSAALDQVQTDLDALIWHFGRAGEFMTGKLNDWGVEIQNQLNLLGPVLAEMVTNFTAVNTALTGGTGTPGDPGKEPRIPIANDMTSLGSGVNDARGALVDFTATVKAATNALGGKAA